MSSTAAIEASEQAIATDAANARVVLRDQFWAAKLAVERRLAVPA
jgi:hypothetical protein